MATDDGSASSSLPDLDARTRELLQRATDDVEPEEQGRLRDEAVRLNMSFARAVAARYRSKGVEWEDLVQVAYLALIKAVAGYDPFSPYRFSAYATVTVRGEVKRWFRDHDWAVRPPRRQQELHSVITRSEPALAQSLGRTPRVVDIASALGVSADEVNSSNAACLGRRSMSLNAPVHDPGGATFADTLPGVEDAYDSVEWQMCLSRAVDRMGPRSRQILRMRFEHEATQAEIGRALGVSQMHVSRLLSRLIDELREDLQVAV